VPDLDPLHFNGDGAPASVQWFQPGGRTIYVRPSDWNAEAGTGRATSEALLRDRDRDRKLAVLACLAQHHYLTTAHVETLLFSSSRVAQLHLRRLEDWGLVLRWHQMEPREVGGWRRQPDLFLLSDWGARLHALSQRQDPVPVTKRAAAAFRYALHIDHSLGVNGFFAGVIQASRELTEEGLYHWVGDDGVRRAFQDRGIDLALDGWGRYLAGDREIHFYLEWDRGTEHPQRLHTKARAAAEAGRSQVLWVAPWPAREQTIRAAIDRQIGRGSAWTTHLGLLSESGPLGAIWLPCPEPGRRGRLSELPGQPRSARRLEDCLGRPGWWKRRPGGTEGM
jgi:hypothetical protein